MCVCIRSEDKADHAQLAKRIALKTQSCVAVPNYRLSPKGLEANLKNPVHHPQHASDILLALTFLGPAPQSDPDPDNGSDGGDQFAKSLDAHMTLDVSSSWVTAAAHTF